MVVHNVYSLDLYLTFTTTNKSFISLQRKMVSQKPGSARIVITRVLLMKVGKNLIQLLKKEILVKGGRDPLIRKEGKNSCVP